MPILFADDTNLLCTEDDMNQLVDKINIDMTNVYAWVQANKLPLNVDKINFMCCTPKRWTRSMTDIENNVCTRVTNDFSAQNTKITVLVTRVHTLFYFLHDRTNPKMTIKTMIFTHHPGVSLARFSFWWWRHKRLLMTSQWPNNCDAIMCKVISNSLDIDFIDGDTHGRSCKKS